MPLAVLVRGNWTFGEDRPGNGKKAWWIDDPGGGTITFAVNLSRGTSQTGGLGYLSSWHPGSGAARVSVLSDPPGWGTTVNASNADQRSNDQQKTSTTDFHRLCVPADDEEAAKVEVVHRDAANSAAVGANVLQTVLPPCGHRAAPRASAAATGQVTSKGASKGGAPIEQQDAPSAVNPSASAPAAGASMAEGEAERRRASRQALQDKDAADKQIVAAQDSTPPSAVVVGKRGLLSVAGALKQTFSNALGQRHADAHGDRIAEHRSDEPGGANPRRSQPAVPAASSKEGLAVAPATGASVASALLQIVVLPRPAAVHNKFVIRYISTC
jgi:hypothetical protein